MKICHPAASAFAIPVLLAAYMALESRLHDEYRDYRTHHILGCMYCRAISTEVSPRYRMPLSWNDAQAPPVPWWLRQVDQRLDPRTTSICGDRGGTHVMDAFIMPHRKDAVVFSDRTEYLLPKKFHRIKSCATVLLILFAVSLPVHLACAWACGRVRRRPHICVLAAAWMWLSASLAALAFGLLIPVGTPVTRMLRECRRTALLLDRSGGRNADWDRIVHLLSDEAVRDCETCRIEFRLTPMQSEAKKWDDTAPFLFPDKYLRRAQIQLAIEAAPHDISLANRFFYGTADIRNDWRTLTERLDQRLVKRNSAYKDWVTRHSYLSGHTAAAIEANMRHELRVKNVSTNQYGFVDVIWCGMELPDVEYLTVYGPVQQDGRSYWIPLHTVVCPEHFPAGYPWRKNTVMMW